MSETSPVLLSVLFKVLFVVLVNVPFVHAQSPAPTPSANSSVNAPANSMAQTSEEKPATAESATPTDEAQKALEKPVAQTDVTTAVNGNFESNFNLGTKYYQEKNYDAAVKAFQDALHFEPESTAALTDLGLSYYQLHKKGLAIAYFRRALFIDPSLPTASSALKFALSELEVKEIPHQIETYERLRSDILNEVSLGGLNLLTALLLFASGFIWLRFWGRRKKSFENEEAPPTVPVIGVLLALGFVTVLALTFLKMYDLSMPRATIIADKVSAQIAPGEGQSSLFELYAGFEVLLSNTTPGWTQVRYPGGLTGWVKNDSLMPSSGQNAF